MCLVPNEYQCGFAKSRGTQNALLTIRTVIKYYNRLDRSTPVHAASLDMSKAFDKINLWFIY